jgi:site-specific DNA-methyltransferase (adenine-specific)
VRRVTPYYADEHVTLYHGDCRELLPSIEADVVVTDPPYGVAWSQHGGGKMGVKCLPPIANDTDTSARDAVLVLWAPRPAVVFGSFYAPPPAGVVQVLVHHKVPPAGVVGSTTGFRRDAEPVYLLGKWPLRNAHASSVLSSRVRLSALVEQHPHGKPVDVLAALILAAPTGTILDPFAGSGTTLVAAKSLGRKAVGIEIDERYCEVAANRCRQEVLGLAV